MPDIVEHVRALQTKDSESSYPYALIILDKNIWLHAINECDNLDRPDNSSIKIIQKIYDCKRNVRYIYQREYFNWVQEHIETYAKGESGVGKRAAVCALLTRYITRFGKQCHHYPTLDKYTHQYGVYLRDSRNSGLKITLSNEDFFLRIFARKNPQSVIITNDDPARMALIEEGIEAYSSKEAIKTFDC